MKVQINDKIVITMSTYAVFVFVILFIIVGSELTPKYYIKFIAACLIVALLSSAFTRAVGQSGAAQVRIGDCRLLQLLHYKDVCI